MVLSPAVAIGLLACLLLGRSAERLLRSGRPSQVVVLLAVSSVLLALGTGIAVGAVALAGLAGITAVADEGRWSVSTVQDQLPIPVWLGVLAMVTVTVLLGRAASRTVGIGVALVRAHQVCRSLASAAPVVVVDDGTVDAYTVAGLRGRVVLSRSLLDALDPDERIVLTAHELSHLHRRHHLYIHAADLAAAANPLLRPVSRAVRLGVERWADEEAAAAVGDRRQAGRTLARIALLRAGAQDHRPPPARTPVTVLAAAGLQVSLRVQALLAPPTRSSRTGLAGAVALTVLVLAVAAASVLRIHGVIEAASWGPPD